jgi:hypothetical protein
MMAGSPKRVKELMAMGVYSATLTTDCGLVLKAFKEFTAPYAELR